MAGGVYFGAQLPGPPREPSGAGLAGKGGARERSEGHPRLDVRSGADFATTRATSRGSPASPRFSTCGKSFCAFQRPGRWPGAFTLAPSSRGPRESPAERVSRGKEEQGSAARDTHDWMSGAERTLRRRGRHRGVPRQVRVFQPAVSPSVPFNAPGRWPGALALAPSSRGPQKSMQM